jgi:hypothetical protein
MPNLLTDTALPLISLYLNTQSGGQPAISKLRVQAFRPETRIAAAW